MQCRIIDSLAQTIIYRAWVAEATIARYAGRGLRRAQNTMDQEVVNNTRISSDSKSCCTVQNLLIDNILPLPVLASTCWVVSQNERLCQCEFAVGKDRWCQEDGSPCNEHGILLKMTMQIEDSVHLWCSHKRLIRIWVWTPKVWFGFSCTLFIWYIRAPIACSRFWTRTDSHFILDSGAGILSYSLVQSILKY